MNQGVKTVIYPVKDLAKAKAFFTKLFGVEPYADSSYYVGYKVGDIDIGLDPHGHKDGLTVYYYVDDIKQSVKDLVAAGAKIIQDVKGVGGGGQIAILKDENGNLIGLFQ